MFIFLSIDNTSYYCSLLRLFDLTFSMPGLSSICLILLVKSVLSVFLECFKYEITEILRCLGISNGLVRPFEHSRSTDLLIY